MSARFVVQALGPSIGLLLCLPAYVKAADLSKVAKQGKMVLQEKCGRCHAIEPVGESPRKEAPPMRDIYARFNPRELQAELSEGMVSRHREMPQIEFSYQMKMSMRSSPTSTLSRSRNEIGACLHGIHHRRRRSLAIQGRKTVADLCRL